MSPKFMKPMNQADYLRSLIKQNELALVRINEVMAYCQQRYNEDYAVKHALESSIVVLQKQLDEEESNATNS